MCERLINESSKHLTRSTALISENRSGTIQGHTTMSCHDDFGLIHPYRQGHFLFFSIDSLLSATGEFYQMDATSLSNYHGPRSFSFTDLNFSFILNMFLAKFL